MTRGEKAQLPNVMLGFFGTTLDAARGPNRWEKWRPTLSALQHDDLLVSRLDLICLNTEEATVAAFVEDIRAVSPETSVNLLVSSLKNPWDFEEVYESLHVLAKHYPFDPEKERYLFHITTGTHVAQICMFLLAETGFLPGDLLQTEPPRKGQREASYSIIDLDLARYDRIARRFEAERTERSTILKSGIATANKDYNALIERIERVASSSTAPILLSGPTGVGKTRLARRIHSLKNGPLVEVNCATLRGDQAMSALFGHKKGAFTGALADRPGLLVAADGGVLFLDEIGELGLDEQAMLLTAIEDKRFLPVGSERPVKVDFQLIAGTNRDLRAAVAAGRFREDLLARIDLWHFQLPSLRDRTEDIDPNIDYELERIARDTNRRVVFHADARKRFLRFATNDTALWNANFRDLGAALTRMATLAPSGGIRVAEVDEEIRRLEEAWTAERANARGGGTDIVEQVLGPKRAAAIDLFDRVQLATVLEVCASSPTAAAAGRQLFDKSRENRASKNDNDRLRKYLARFELDFESARSGSSKS